MHTENHLSASGPYDDLGSHGRNPNFNPRIPIFCKLPGQNLIQLREEHSICHKLKNPETKIEAFRLVDAKKGKLGLAFRFFFIWDVIFGAFWGLQSVIFYSGKKRLEVPLPTMVLVCAATLSSSTLLLQKSVPLASQSSRSAFGSSFLFHRENGSVVVCHAKKKLSFVDQILDYIEGGPKLRKWYGAPDLLPKDGTATDDDEDDYPEDEVRDAVLVTDGDSEMGQMVILSLIVKRTRIKALVKDKRVALEAFGSYVESMAGDRSDNRFLKKALRGVRTIICPNEGFLSSVGSLQGAQHVILLSQLSVYSGKSGIQSLMKSNAKKLAEQDESVLMTSGIPYTIIRTGVLQDRPGGKQGFTFDEGCAASGSLSKEDAAFVCVEALDCVPQTGFIIEVANGEKKVSDWKECLAGLMEKASQQLQ